MSADLLAEFDSYYKAPKDAPSSAPATNDLSFLGIAGNNGLSDQGGALQPWQNSPAKPVDDVWANFQPAASPQPAPAEHNGIWSSVGTTATNTQTPPVLSPVYRGATAAVGGKSDPVQSGSGLLRRPTMDIFSYIPNSGETPSSRSPIQTNRFTTQKPPPRVTQSSSGEVLFDAEEAGLSGADDDDFGEFESVTVPEPPAQAPPSNSLTSMFGATSLESRVVRKPNDLLPTTNALGSTLPYPKAPKSPSFQERNPFADLGLSINQMLGADDNVETRTASPVTAWPTFEPKIPKPIPYEDSPAPDNNTNDDWGDFADSAPKNQVKPSSDQVKSSAKASSVTEGDTWGWNAVDPEVPESLPVKADQSPPSNIPPPSILLTLFPSIFDLPQSALLNPVAGQPFSMKNRIISDPSTVEFLRAYLLISTVSARIIAGRKLRWKRDTLLSQAMKIGPAAAGGKGGMKLAGVDKAETTREDREAADVVRLWKEQVGRLRSAIAVANSSIHDTSRQLAIPDVSNAMHIKTQQGALTSSKPCIICGLKREERISKVDFDVEDSFGEWWTEHWGHRACRNFWLEHEEKLNKR